MKKVIANVSIIKKELENAKKKFDESESNSNQNYFLGRINALQFVLECGIIEEE